MEKPKRAYEVVIKIGANTKEDLVAGICAIADDFDIRGVGSIASGSPSAGWTIETEIDPNITPEKYAASLKDFVAQIKKTK